MNKKLWGVNFFSGWLVGLLMSISLTSYPSMESLLVGLGCLIVMMFIILYNKL